jgi:hypothetical protein
VNILLTEIGIGNENFNTPLFLSTLLNYLKNSRQDVLYEGNIFFFFFIFNLDFIQNTFFYNRNNFTELNVSGELTNLFIKNFEEKINDSDLFNSCSFTESNEGLDISINQSKQNKSPSKKKDIFDNELLKETVWESKKKENLLILQPNDQLNLKNIPFLKKRKKDSQKTVSFPACLIVFYDNNQNKNSIPLTLNFEVCIYYSFVCFLAKTSHFLFLFFFFFLSFIKFIKQKNKKKKK